MICLGAGSWCLLCDFLLSYVLLKALGCVFKCVDLDVFRLLVACCGGFVFAGDRLDCCWRCDAFCLGDFWVFTCTIVL